nr:hypothetical protein [Pandoravirus aubagnensis]
MVPCLAILFPFAQRQKKRRKRTTHTQEEEKKEEETHTHDNNVVVSSRVSVVSRDDFFPFSAHCRSACANGADMFVCLWMAVRSARHHCHPLFAVTKKCTKKRECARTAALPEFGWMCSDRARLPHTRAAKGCNYCCCCCACAGVCRDRLCHRPFVKVDRAQTPRPFFCSRLPIAPHATRDPTAERRKKK